MVWQKTPTFRCSLRSSELQTLEFLASNRWSQFFVQGGKIDKATNNECKKVVGSYSISGLWIDAGTKIYIGSWSQDVEPQVELFKLHISIDAGFGDPLKEVRFRPRRAPLNDTPSDLDLSSFLNSYVHLSVLKIPEELILGSDVTEEESFVAVVDSALLATSPRGSKFLLYQDPDIPAGLAITTSLDTIDAMITNSHEVMLI